MLDQRSMFHAPFFEGNLEQSTVNKTGRRVIVTGETYTLLSLNGEKAQTIRTEHCEQT